MPAKFIAVPFAAIISEAATYKFPLPKEAAPPTVSRFGGGGGFGGAAQKVDSNAIVTRAVKVTSVSFTPSAAATAAGKMTALNLTTTSAPASTVQTHTIIAFPTKVAEAAAASSGAITKDLNLRIFVDKDTVLTVSGPGTIALFGEEFVDTFTPKREARKAKKRARKLSTNKLPLGEGEEDGSDFDDGRSWGADDMYNQGIIYN